MLNPILRIFWILILMTVAVAPGWAQRGWGAGRSGPGHGVENCIALLHSIPKQALDSTEAAGLAYIREEEKLAHDVFVALQTKWGARVFGNILQSKDSHSSAIRILLDRYGLPDPAANRPAGAFKNDGLRELYIELIRQGTGSVKSAMRAGATMEDLNIHDLNNAAAATDNSDLKLLYQGLRQASENHLRAFVRQLAADGENYTPQYITPADFFDIMAGSAQSERGFGARGNGPRGLKQGNSGNCSWQ